MNKHRNAKIPGQTKILQLISEFCPVAWENWQLVIKDHHDGYITWDKYLENQTLLANNRTNSKEDLLPGPLREGLTLLQGLLICSICGRRLTVRYTGNNGIYPGYLCAWTRVNGLNKGCMWVRSDLIDAEVVRRVFEIINPAQLKIAISALIELQQRQDKISKQWEMKIQRMEYEAQLAQRRYEEVDPSNRLVASTLEQRWNNALVGLEEVRLQYTLHQQKEASIATEQQKQQLLSLAQDLPRLWKSETTTAKDRKRILRLIIKDITVEVFPERIVTLHIRWHGGATKDIKIAMPKKIHAVWKTSPEIIQRIPTC